MREPGNRLYLYDIVAAFLHHTLVPRTTHPDTFSELGQLSFIMFYLQADISNVMIP